MTVAHPFMHQLEQPCKICRRVSCELLSGDSILVHLYSMKAVEPVVRRFSQIFTWNEVTVEIDFLERLRCQKQNPLNYKTI